MSRAVLPRASARISWLRRVISSAAAPGEGQQQQALRIAAVLDQMSHPVGERLGLAGTGSGGDQ